MSEAGTQGMGEVVAVRAEAQGVEKPWVRRDERGMISAEWAVGLIAAIAIAGVLLGVVTDGTVKAALLRFIIRVIGAFAGNL